MVLLAQPGVLPEGSLRVPSHERKVERPPGQADDRYEDELLFQEELQHRDASVQHMLQDEDVDPRLVIAVHQVPALVAKVRNACNVPRGALRQAHPGAVAGNPARGNGVEQWIDLHTHALRGDHQLDQGEYE